MREPIREMGRDFRPRWGGCRKGVGGIGESIRGYGKRDGGGGRVREEKED